MEQPPQKLLLARHAETGEEYYGRFVGSSDIGLGPNGPRQALELAEKAAAYNPAIIYTSPLQRARYTAEIVGRKIGAQVIVRDDLREVDFGRWELRSFAEIAKGDAELVKRWSVWSPDFTFPEGERVGDFLHRVRLVTDDIVASGNDSVLVIAHGGVVRAMLCHCLRLAPEHYLLFDAQPARLTRIDMFNEGGVLKGFNV